MIKIKPGTSGITVHSRAAKLEHEQRYVLLRNKPELNLLNLETCSCHAQTREQYDIADTRDPENTRSHQEVHHMILMMVDGTRALRKPVLFHERINKLITPLLKRASETAPVWRYSREPKKLRCIPPTHELDRSQRKANQGRDRR